ncbi:NitT/TauT family transport system substrate-binding protein [Nocardiopsis arvandica]|uniref:NitT/TauT family transport system substrate-binding protein n=1 Tax=Nocardiopsis sinuspersici TaxID=501010 RepID=A0A7Y9XGA9_9ACTN|nr:ABC transporter substrate-binding protein [Nocardiopsis sinuspersici]NYH55184.1 NitT/TauT family transport system substrate-binding protein [Nocardiopsis sinuspersici]
MRRQLTALLGIAVLVPATACGGAEEGEGDGLRQVTAGAIPIVDVAPLHLGVEQGFFSDRGIDLEIQPGSGGAAAIPGVISGNFEFAFGNVVSVMVARDQGLPLKIFSNGVASNGEQGADFSAVFVLDDSPVQDAADLEGMTVAANNLKNIGDTTVRQSVRKAGGDPSSVEFVEMGLPDMVPALENEQVDAIWLVEPFTTMATEAGHREIASNLVDTHPDLTVAAYFTSERMLDQDPELIADVEAALRESLAYAQDNPDEVRRIVPTYTEIDQALLDQLRLPRWPAEVDKESVGVLADLMLQDGLIESEADLEALYQ